MGPGLTSILQGGRSWAGGGSREEGTEMGEKEETLTPQLEGALNPGCR